MMSHIRLYPSLLLAATLTLMESGAALAGGRGTGRESIEDEQRLHSGHSRR